MLPDTERARRVRIFCPRRDAASQFRQARCGYVERAELTEREIQARIATPCPSCHRVGLDAVEER